MRTICANVHSRAAGLLPAAIRDPDSAQGCQLMVRAPRGYLLLGCMLHVQMAGWCLCGCWRTQQQQHPWR